MDTYLCLPCVPRAQPAVHLQHCHCANLRLQSRSSPSCAQLCLWNQLQIRRVQHSSPCDKIDYTVEPHPKKSSPGQSSALWCDATPPGTCVGRHPSSSRQRPLLRHSRGNNSWARDTAPHGSKLSTGQVKREILLAKPVGGQPDSIQLFCMYVS